MMTSTVRAVLEGHFGELHWQSMALNAEDVPPDDAKHNTMIVARLGPLYIRIVNARGIARGINISDKNTARVDKPIWEGGKPIELRAFLKDFFPVVQTEPTVST